MARKPKSVYKRIEDKEKEIKITEEHLNGLKETLQILYAEKDELEMKQLLLKMKEKGLTLSETLEGIDKIDKTKIKS